MKKIVLMLIIVILLSNFIITTNVRAEPNTIVRGYVYLNDTLIKPQEVHLMISNQTRTGDIYNNWRYQINFEGENPNPGSIGVFNITYNGESYTPTQTITILEGVYTYNINLTINQTFVADAGELYTGTICSAVQFTGTATGGNPPYTWDWNFGDGTAHSNLQNPTHQYVSDGSYTATLTVNDSYSTKAEDTVPVTITTSVFVVAEASGPYSGPVGYPISFSGNANGGCIPYTYSWSFGDGGTGLGQNPTHQYAANGNYTVIVTVTDDKGISDTDTASVTISNTALVANANGPYNGFIGIAISFNSSASGGCTPYNYKWNFGDGTEGSGITPTHIYSNFGVYNVTLTVTDNFGVTYSNTTTASINILPNTPSNPNPSNHKTSIGINDDLSWTCGDQNTNDTITYDIYFGKTSNPPLVKSNHTNTSYDPGTMSYNTKYYWKIVRKDNNGLSTTGPIWDFTTIYVNQQSTVDTPPTANAGGPYSVNINQTITLDASKSTDPDGEITGYRWDWNNDGVYDTKWSKNQTDTHIYNNAGTYTVKLQVKDNFGAADSDTTLVTVSQGNIKIQANAGGPYYEIIGISFQFDGSKSYSLNGINLTYKWSFGEGNTSTLKKPNHTYYKEGNYTVKLTITDDYNKTDTNTTFAIISKKPNHPPEKPTISGIISSHINTNCYYNIKASDFDDDKIQYIINWRDGTNKTISPLLNSNTEFNISHSWSTGGIYNIIIYTLDENNASSDNQNYTVLINAHYCGSLGYLVDKNGDGTFDVFYNETTGKETNTQKNNNDYNIDINDDQKWDYTFNLITNKISIYGSSATQQSSISNIIPKGIPLIITIIFLIIYLIFLLKNLILIKNENQQGKKPDLEIKEIYSPAKTNKIYAFTTNDEKIKNIHEEIDKLISNITIEGILLKKGKIK